MSQVKHEWQLIHLQFGRNTAHFGELGIGLEGTTERVRSDTLFSAWITIYARLYGNDEVEKLLKEFCSDHPPFRLSSTFIYDSRSQEPTYYLPRPLKSPRNFRISSESTLMKDYKKLKYLPLEIWQHWYQSSKGFSEQELNIVLGKTGYTSTFEIEKIPKIAVDRMTRATNLYYTGFVRYHWQQKDHKVESLTGLYFLAQFSTRNSFWQTKFLEVLEVLGQEGIGGERSSGAGQFTVAPATQLPAIWKQVTEYKQEKVSYTLISLLWQAGFSDATLQNTAYELQERGGWISSPLMSHQRRRKSVQMFAEGSVFAQDFPGMLAPVTPDGFESHPIYRSGLAVSLPIRVE